MLNIFTLANGRLFVEIGRVAARRTIFLSWFTYFQGQQRWIVGNADLPSGATSITVPMFVTSGAQFGTGFNPSQVVVAPWGSTTVSFPTCTTLRFQWSETGGQTGLYNYRRQVDGLEGISCP